MQLLTLLSLPLLGTSALEVRQSRNGNTPANFAPSPYAPRLHADAKRSVTRVGPYVLKAASTGPGGGSRGGGMGGMGMGDNTLGGQNFMVRINKGICNADSTGPCTVFGGNVSVQFEDGTKADPASGVYIHHLLTMDTSKPPVNFLSACNAPNRVGMSMSGIGGSSGFIGTGEDSGEEPIVYTQRDGRSNAGYWVGPEDKFVGQLVLVNYNKEPKTVYLAYDVEWKAGKPPSNTKGMLISISQCGVRINLKNNEPTSSKSGQFTFLEDGDILAARGHLHDGGVKMDMNINDKLVCSSKATYGGSQSTAEVGGQQWQTISSMSYCDGPIPVKKGDRLSMVVDYDLTKHPLRKSASGAEATGVMGMWSITFAPKADF